ncbi:hypothetical protein MVES1_002838 [Malassezia vespertilionis]|uniref:uncharacterized protein n=1 Tax=Malassezia vespertilionis TaxID=2020962 RepID=UPI0024B0B6FB|nr:uncharacterized protein MVES1_002838 [Malassezia vespertilionis]WFD07472.1 hypothetical protein MVES1_002838 [Malassezia vespertilionis]
MESTLHCVPADPNAAREAPTPLLFIASPEWTKGEKAGEKFKALIGYAKAQGFSSLLLDLDPPGVKEAKSLGNILSLMEEDMVKTLRNPPAEVGPMPFPPALVAYGRMCLVAEAYASSHPLSALQLVNPPLSIHRAAEWDPEMFRGAESPPEFDFEAQFPVRVVWTSDALAEQAGKQVPWYEVHRIEYQREDLADMALDRYQWKDMDQGAEDAIGWFEQEAGLTVPAGTFPPWFTDAYSFARDGSKKMPITLCETDLQERFIRGSGPGGQAINKLATNVELVHLPTGTRITCQATRSRPQNREIARRLMSQKLEYLIKKDWAFFGAGNAMYSPSVLQSKWDKARRKKRNRQKKQRRRTVNAE